MKYDDPLRHRTTWLMLLGLATGCPDPVPSDDPGPTSIGPTSIGPTSIGPTGTTTSADGSASGTGTSAGTTVASTTTEDNTGPPPTLFDQGVLPDMPIVQPTCEVVDDMNAVGDCMETAPPDSFEPDVQWEWLGEGVDQSVVVTPLVANLTDDDGNGTIDLCDIPDVVVVASADILGPAHIYVLDGETGAVHFSIPDIVGFSTAPALGDIDGDGLPEIVTATPGGNLIAFEHDGTLKWQGALWNDSYIAALALADMDNDGDVEILGSNQLFDHMGTLLWTAPMNTTPYSATTAADLDGDGDLEMVLGHAALHHDGSVMWSAAIAPGFPQVADLDGDMLPEILLTNPDGLALLEHDGTITYQGLRPTGASPGGVTWLRPATIHDFDGDGLPEYAMSSANDYSVFEADGSLSWSAPVADFSGIAAGTAFDFLGDGNAEAMYADETSMFIFDAAGGVLLDTPRSSPTGTEYPVVADIDNDGSAEIVVVSTSSGPGGSPPVQVIRDIDDRWIQARRIWNQHTYHVTNVREDGTIPQLEPPAWASLNTFRTNAQIEGGGICVPDPAG